MREIQKVIIDNIEPNYKTISIAIDNVIIDDNNNDIARRGRDRRAFVPGELKGVQMYIHEKAPNVNNQEILDVLSVMWTPDVIAAYEASLNDA